MTLLDTLLWPSSARCFTWAELDQLAGKTIDDASLASWRANTNYEGYKEEDAPVGWFWEVHHAAQFNGALYIMVCYIVAHHLMVRCI